MRKKQIDTDAKLIVIVGSPRGGSKELASFYSGFEEFAAKKYEGRLGKVDDQKRIITLGSEKQPLLVTDKETELPILNYDFAKRIGCVVGFSECLDDTRIFDRKYLEFLQACPVVTVSDDTCGQQRYPFNTTHYNVAIGNEHGLYDYRAHNKIGTVKTVQDLDNVVANMVLNNEMVQLQALKGMTRCEMVVRRMMEDYSAMLNGNFQSGGKKDE